MAEITITPYNAPNKAIPSMPLMAFDITPSNTDTFSQPVMIECLTDGNVVVIPFAGDETGDKTATVTRAMVAGQVLNFAVRAVKETDTTATVGGLF